MSNPTLSVPRGQQTPVGAAHTCRVRNPALHRGHSLTLAAEPRPFLAPELLRLAVKRPQIRDAAMSPSTAQQVARMRTEQQSPSRCLQILWEITELIFSKQKQDTLVRETEQWKVRLSV